MITLIFLDYFFLFKHSPVNESTRREQRTTTTNKKIKYSLSLSMLTTFPKTWVDFQEHENFYKFKENLMEKNRKYFNYLIENFFFFSAPFCRRILKILPQEPRVSERDGK